MNKIKAGLLIFSLLVCSVLGFSEAIIIGIIFIIILILIAVFSKREKSTQEKHHELIDVKPKERK